MQYPDPVPARIEALRNRYLEAILAEDAVGARSAVEEATAAGVDPISIYLQILAPSLREVGELWHRDEIGVDREHWASEHTLEEMARLRDRHRPSAPRGSRSRPTVVVAAVEGELHGLPARIVADLLGWRGFDVTFLGCDLPTEDLVTHAEQAGPDLIALSVTHPDHLENAVEAIRRLAELDPRPRILAGGAAFRDGQRPPELEADAVEPEILDGLTRARELVGLGKGPELPDYLAMVGSRIRSLRRERDLTQAALAEGAGLTRPYLSAIEQGRQNITLEAALALARALEVPISELVSDRS